MSLARANFVQFYAVFGKTRPNNTVADPRVDQRPTDQIFAGSLESANSSILPARNLFKDFGGEKIRILC